MSGRSTRIAVVSVCVVLAVAGTLAALLLFGGTKTKVAGPSSAVGQEDLETLLSRVARPLDPKLRAKLAEAVLSESARGGYDPLFILGLVSVESGFRPHVSSERGAYGLMQLQPSTFAWIAWRERRFPRREEALMAYNAGPSRLRHYKRARIPSTVRAYPRKVMREYSRFARMLGRPDPRGVILARAD